MTGAQLSIALFMHDLSGGGVERMRLRLAAGLAARNYHVTLIVQRRRGSLLAAIPACVALASLECDGVWRSAGRLAAMLRQRRFDILVSSLDHNNIAALAAGILAGGRTRIIICQHNALSGERALGWKYRVVPLCYRFLAPFAAAIVAVSQGVADDMAARTGIARTRINTLFNPVTDGGATGMPWCPPPHPWFGQATPVYLFIGRLTPQKDPEILLRAFALRLRTGPARLVLLGEGELQPVLEDLAAALGVAHSVYFAGFVTDPIPWLARAHALILCSRYEGFGNVIVESLGCGTPVISTDCPHGPAEILQHGRFGRLVPVGDAVALAAAMQCDMRQAFAADTLRARAACFSVDACIDQHEQIFARVVRRYNGRAFGVGFSDLSAGAVAQTMATTAPDGGPGLIVTPNIDHVRLLWRPDFAAAYQGAALVCADGAPVTLYAWLRSATRLRRVTGCDIFHHLVRHPALPTRLVLVVVESPATRTALRHWLSERCLVPRWRIEVAPPDLAGTADAAKALCAAINSFAPDIVIMTLGAPVSEEFVHRNRALLPACWVLSCGQAVRVELGLARRAPRPVRLAGLEWAWRALQEPRRLVPRYARAALWFPRAVIADLSQALPPAGAGVQ